MSPQERSEIRRALDGAVLHVALLAASLRVNRRLVLRLNPASRYEIKYAATRHPLMTTASAAIAVRFLDQLGVGPDLRNVGEQITRKSGEVSPRLSSFCSTENANKSVAKLPKAEQNQSRDRGVVAPRSHCRNHLNFPR